MSDKLCDINIVGGGPTGLFGAFYAGLRGVSCRIIDSLPELGGQLTALYPEKYIFDVGGIPKVLAKDLAADLVEQGLQFGADVVLNARLDSLDRLEGGRFAVRSGDRSLRSRTVVIAGGKGAFSPMRLKCPGFDHFEDRGLNFTITDKEALRGKRVVVIGGGDSALDFVLMLRGVASSLTLVHRRDGWRAHESSVAALMAAQRADEIDVRTFCEVRRIEGGARLERLAIFDNRKKGEGDEETVIEADAVLSCLGFKPDLGPIRGWGLRVNKNRIVVDHLMRTNREGVYAAGDVTGYEGKLDLIATGFAEVAIAVNQAVHYMDPKARVNPGHSTNLKIFKGK